MQGVGFRPFVYRLATELGLAGWVLNSSAGLVVEVEGDPDTLQRFLARLDEERPAASVILTREQAWLPAAGLSPFEIRQSDISEARSAGVLPDLATCPECIAEFSDPLQRRYGYPFTNCTRCGPRYTIVRDIPYDRPNTTLAEFELCPVCRAEYTDPGDRRFHAQPIACPVCGPRLDTAVADAATALGRGEIVALKGIGGFQFLVDARDAEAVTRLRSRKHRDAKPFALMMPNLETIRLYCRVSRDEERVLCSAAAPIVLLEPNGTPGLAPNVSEASPFYGVMLPYSPLHHLLFGAFPHAIVATSGNISGDPIAIEQPPSNVADLIVSHNRPIARPVDDSVVRVTRGRECVLRRARGYAPLPVRVSRLLPPVIAVGAHLKNAVAIAVGNNVYLSQHIGDLDSLESRHAFATAISDLCRLYRFEPEAVVCDLHPDYASTMWARESGLPVIAVQHHQAHAASCAAENDLAEPYLAVSWDGTGYGLDESIWGGEFFAVGEGRMERVAHLRPFRLPGGEAAIREGWRAAESLLFELQRPSQNPAIRRMLERNLNSPLTTSVGRLFDAIASLTGIARESRFEGEAAMKLERAASGDGAYELPGGDWRPLVEAVLAEPDPGIASARFHRALAEWIVSVAAQTGLHDVVLSGGCFQNARLTNLACELLESAGHRVHTHQRVPPNDGGIALGQAMLCNI